MDLQTFSLSNSQTAFDAELYAVVKGLELLAIRGEPGRSFRVFTDSQATILRLQSDAPGPGQSLARRGIRLAKIITEQHGASLDTRPRGSRGK